MSLYDGFIICIGVKLLNKTIENLLSRTSIKSFNPNFKIPGTEEELIIKSAKQAPTWMNGQNFQIVIFKDQMKKQLANMLMEAGDMSNSIQINHCSIFLLFCIDYHLYTGNGAEFDFKDEIEPLLISTTDLSLAAENAVIAAESLNLGSCVIGGVRRISEEIIELLNMPKYTYPLFGVAIGQPSYPKQSPKPRLSDKVNVLDANIYSRKLNIDDFKIYYENLKLYAHQNNYKTSPWLQRFEKYYTDKSYPNNTKDVLKKQCLF